MAAPPYVANAEAQASLNEAADIVGPPSVWAAWSSKRLRVARELHDVNRMRQCLVNMKAFMLDVLSMLVAV
jgi:hypothetical protein